MKQKNFYKIGLLTLLLLMMFSFAGCNKTPKAEDPNSTETTTGADTDTKDEPNSSETPDPTETPDPSQTPDPSETPEPTESPEPIEDSTPTSPEATATPSPEPKNGNEPTATPTPAPNTTAPRATATPTPRPAVTAVPRATATPTPRPTATTAPRATATPTPRPTATPTPSSSNSATTYRTILSADFENNTFGFTTRGGSAVVGLSNNFARSGKQSLRVSGRTSTWHGATLNMTSDLLPGKTYHVSAWVFYNNGPGELRIDSKIQKNGNEAYLSFGTVNAKRGTWTKMEGTIVIPSDTRTADFYFEANSATEDFYIDDIILSEVIQNTSFVTQVPSLKEAYKNIFNVGVATAQRDLDAALTKTIVTHHFNTITMENEMKPSALLDHATSSGNLARHRENAALNLQNIDLALKFAQDNGLKVRFHTLVWHSQTPRWFFTENYSTAANAPLASKELMLKRMENYIKQIMEHTKKYPGVIYAWDVVNEAIEPAHNRPNGFRSSDSLWYQIVGEEFVEKAFEFARKYSYDNAGLFYNDYNEYMEPKRTHIYNLLNRLKDKGLIDGMGMQSHIDLGFPSIANYEATLKKYGELGLEIHVTELDIHNTSNTEAGLARHADRYGEIFEVLIRLKRNGSANITNVTFWGVLDSNSWLTAHRGTASYPLLFDKDGNPKPAFFKIIELSKR